MIPEGTIAATAAELSPVEVTKLENLEIVIEAVEACPNCGGNDWDSDELGRYCGKCKEPRDSTAAPPPQRLGKGVALANEAINALSRIPKNDKLRARAWQIVRDWLDANEGGAK